MKKSVVKTCELEDGWCYVCTGEHGGDQTCSRLDVARMSAEAVADSALSIIVFSTSLFLCALTQLWWLVVGKLTGSREGEAAG